jgi:hypothetical protein
MGVSLSVVWHYTPLQRGSPARRQNLAVATLTVQNDLPAMVEEKLAAGKIESCVERNPAAGVAQEKREAHLARWASWA